MAANGITRSQSGDLAPERVRLGRILVLLTLLVAVVAVLLLIVTGAA